jgi:hypothetical protein
MEQDNESLLRRLRKPASVVDVVLDTDSYNGLCAIFLTFFPKYVDKIIKK